MRNLTQEMTSMALEGQDCWLTRVMKLEKLLDIKLGTSSNTIMSKIKSKFDFHWLQRINQFKPSKSDPFDHNKLRTYKSFKGCFKREPYIDFIRNRNQRTYLTRLRIGAHTLAIEIGRRNRPITPVNERVCSFCQADQNCDMPNQTSYSSRSDGAIDDEMHFLISCPRFKNTRQVFYSAYAASFSDFDKLKDDDKFTTLMCPTNPQAVKIANRYIKFMFDQRAKITSGINFYNL